MDFENGSYEDNTPRRPRASRIGAGVLGLMLLGGGVFFVMWFIVRQEVGANEVLIYVNKTGRTLPPELSNEFGDQVVLYPELVKALAAKDGISEEEVVSTYKGIQYNVLPAGRYFPNPYDYLTVAQPAEQIVQGELGVKIRRYGKPLPFPKTVASEPDERGPVAEILLPGRHDINTYAYEIQRFDAVRIPEGHVGVVTLLSGTDPMEKNTYTVAPGEKGVQYQTLPPGEYYENPYLKQIEIVDVRSHKYDMLDADAIQFPSSDSFTITIEGTIEWALRPNKVAEVTVAYGDEEDILNKIILPNARSISRIQGSKLRAREFISGKTRSAFQDRLLEELKRECWKQGIDIRAALVRDIQPPSEIASLISMREQADQEIERSTNEMEEAKAQAMLVEQQELKEQNKHIGDARRQVVTMTQEAKQRKVVAVTKSNRELEVAKLALQAAEKQAEATRSRGQAEANVVLFNYQAEAEPLARTVQAFGDGDAYARQFFFKQIAPSIQTILTNTDGPLAEVFTKLVGGSSTSSGEAQ